MVGFPMVSLGKKEEKRGRILGVLTSLSLTFLYEQKEKGPKFQLLGELH
jgi:hypothetical protein